MSDHLLPVKRKITMRYTVQTSPEEEADCLRRILVASNGVSMPAVQMDERRIAWEFASLMTDAGQAVKAYSDGFSSAGRATLLELAGRALGLAMASDIIALSAIKARTRETP